MAKEKMYQRSCKLIVVNFLCLWFALSWSNQVESLNICEKCVCQDNKPYYLVDCSQTKLEDLFTEEDWNETLATNSISRSTQLDVRFDFNELIKVTKLPALNISSLSFSNNYIDYIEKSAFAELTTLVSLDLSHNNLDADGISELSLFGQFNGSQFYFPLSVEHLTLAHNNIHRIEKNVFDHLPYLTTLDLSSNPLKVLSGSTTQALSQLSKLQVLDLANTSISEIPGGLIHDLRFLESLDLADNLFTKVPYELSNNHNLTHLDLSGNKFETLDHTSFMGLDNIIELKLNSMPTLKQIETGTFTSMKKMQIFHCAYNRKLTRFSDGAFMGITNDSQHWPIEEMYLNDNGLTTLDKAMAAWEHVDTLNIQNNPFRCDCDIQWLAEVLVPQIEFTNSKYVTDVVCRDPPELRGRNLLSFSFEHEEFLKCETGSKNLNGDFKVPYYPYQAAGIVVLTIGVILIVIGVSILGVIVVKRRAIALALMDHQQIRYERADTDEEDTHHEVHRHYRQDKF